MNKATLLRLHRWVTFAFMIPIAAVIVTGLVLSVEPVAHYAAVKPGTLKAQRIGELLEPAWCRDQGCRRVDRTPVRGQAMRM